MQDFRDNVKKTIKNARQLAILDFISAKCVMGVSPCPCVSPDILFYIHGPATLLFYYYYVNITILLKFKMAVTRPF